MTVLVINSQPQATSQMHVSLLNPPVTIIRDQATTAAQNIPHT